MKGKLVLHQWQVHRSMHQVWPVVGALVTVKKSIGNVEAAVANRASREKIHPSCISQVPLLSLAGHCSQYELRRKRRALGTTSARTHMPV